MVGDQKFDCAQAPEPAPTETENAAASKFLINARGNIRRFVMVCTFASDYFVVIVPRDVTLKGWSDAPLNHSAVPCAWDGFV